MTERPLFSRYGCPSIEGDLKGPSGINGKALKLFGICIQDRLSTSGVVVPVEDPPPRTTPPSSPPAHL